ncbi:MAG: hypothetical protein EXQ48_05250 [Acidobacteria bacterium]|nr:hypothetical protein [Acidobacteriota bacterium]
MRFKSLCVAVLCVVVLGTAASAHHSHNNYDVAKWTPLEGTVTEVHWLVPHSWIYLEITNEKGEKATWALEAANPTSIMENGVTKQHVLAGDHIKVRCHLLRDGQEGCLLGFVTPMHGDAARGHGVEREWD